MPRNPNERANSYRGRAGACRIAAQMTNNRDIRATYLDLASQWEMLAGQIERLESERWTVHFTELPTKSPA
jgi:hypothetical protein